MQTTFTVPDAPVYSQEQTTTYVWSGLESLFSNGNWEEIIQPEVVWGIVPGTWVIQAQAGQNGNGYFNPAPIAVNVGDTIVATLTQTAEQANNNEVWTISAVDSTNGNWTSLNWTTGAGWPSFNWAQMGVYEPQGLAQCDGLSASEIEIFGINYIYQAGPYWNSMNNVTGQMSWSYNGSTSYVPYCDYYAEPWSSPNGTLLRWQIP